MTKEITRKLNSFIKIKKRTKELEFHVPKTRKTRKQPRTAPSAPLYMFTWGDIYILAWSGHPSALDHTLSTLDCTRCDFALAIGTSLLKRTCFRIGQIL